MRKIPNEVSAIIGDAVHNMRSALDHLIWQLFNARQITPDPRQFISYPIFNSPDNFKATDPKIGGLPNVLTPFYVPVLMRVGWCVDRTWDGRSEAESDPSSAANSAGVWYPIPLCNRS
jgi:hypothetical protein